MRCIHPLRRSLRSEQAPAAFLAGEQSKPEHEERVGAVFKPRANPFFVPLTLQLVPTRT